MCACVCVCVLGTRSVQARRASKHIQRMQKHAITVIYICYSNWRVASRREHFGRAGVCVCPTKRCVSVRGCGCGEFPGFSSSTPFTPESDRTAGKTKFWTITNWRVSHVVSQCFVASRRRPNLCSSSARCGVCVCVQFDVRVFVESMFAVAVFLWRGLA